jgi:hypothetical protein
MKDASLPVQIVPKNASTMDTIIAEDVLPAAESFS